MISGCVLYETHTHTHTHTHTPHGHDHDHDCDHDQDHPPHPPTHTLLTTLIILRDARRTKGWVWLAPTGQPEGSRSRTSLHLRYIGVAVEYRWPCAEPRAEVNGRVLAEISTFYCRQSSSSWLRPRSPRARAVGPACTRAVFELLGATVSHVLNQEPRPTTK